MDRSNGEHLEGSITGCAAEGAVGEGPAAGAADFLQLRTADAPSGGLTDWLAGELRAAIADGRLPVGTR
ncbi:PLP-dependent aminotransferase family protein, partial [Streptomyces sp. T-3]|nr:PLP-dependent aminotransferase family protein [Streptomyces sp. T-3]